MPELFVRLGRRWIWNRYALTALAGFVWIAFISEIDLFYILRTQRELAELEDQVIHYRTEIGVVRADLQNIQDHPAHLERVAREVYYMARPNEDLFRIVPAATAQTAP
jgi:cell division protein DivIC